ncbi:MAG TPA: lipopolysaccharide kinase InaA family protein [Gemmataceae bacterium]|nr:lipopolysaccharide kinase InaA family protein [Gemmataceae bacterium]
MARLFINPRYREVLLKEGLEKAEDFVRLSGVIYCGHPHRHVARLNLCDSLSVFLKKEHRVRWHDRLANFWAGFGFVSKSWRELATDRMLEQAGIRRPEVIAAGETSGQAFLLLREVPDAVELRSFLEKETDPLIRRRLARKLGQELARMHAAGIDHPDLVSKHVLVQPETMEFCFLDWQRSRRHQRMSWSRRCRDLAALDATLGEDLTTDRERLICFHSYVRTKSSEVLKTSEVYALVKRIRAIANRLLKKRYIRELRRPGLMPGKQNLIWLDGEAVCVTREFREEIRDRLPGWLDLLRKPARSGQEVHRRLLPLPGDRAGRLIRRRQSRPWSWLWNWLRGRSWVSPEMEQAATFFRLERNGISPPRLLAVGQRRTKPWLTESFILTEPASSRIRLVEWLSCRKGRTLTKPEVRQFRQVIQQAGAVLARIHETGTFLDAGCDPRMLFDLEIKPPEPPRVVLAGVEGLCRRRNAKWSRALQDLRKIHGGLASVCSRTDARRFLLGYFDLPRLTPAARRMAGLRRTKRKRAVA